MVSNSKSKNGKSPKIEYNATICAWHTPCLVSYVASVERKQNIEPRTELLALLLPNYEII
jgi:hypothetical protein